MHSAEVKRTALGVVRKPHGVRGGLKVTLYSIDLDTLQNLEQFFVNTGNNWKQLSLRSCQGYDDFAILAFKEIVDRNKAEIYREHEIFANDAELPTSGEDGYLIDDLVGCEVVDEKNMIMGEVVEVLSPASHDILVVHKGASENLIPLVDEWIREVDLDTRHIYVNSVEELK